MTIPKMLGAMCLMCLLVACGEQASQTPTQAATPSAAEVSSQPQEVQPQTTEQPAQAVADETAQSTDVPKTDANTAQTETNTAQGVSEQEFEAIVAAADKLPSDAGLKRYEATCKMCHTAGLFNAPKIGDKAAWAPRIAKGRQTLYSHSANGFNQMPAQLVGDVTKEEVLASVDYIISKSS